MRYVGRIQNIKGETIEVVIVSNYGSSSEPVEITLAGESPIIISQTSSDGIFSPIKSRSCTITIISKETYFDMYSGSSHGTTVKVNNLSQGECLFFGYLTPCEYNQPYLYLNEIELEAVDAVSTLQDFKYKYQNNWTSKLVTIESVLKYCLHNIAGYSGSIYVPKYGLQMKSSKDLGSCPTEIEYISEEAFVDDDDAMSCYEVLEEICNFYNVSLVPYGNDVYLVDYELIAKYDVNHSWFPSSDFTIFKNLSDDVEEDRYVPGYIQKEDYCGDDQNIEMDEVFNKVSVKVETKEIDDEDLLYDPMNDINSTTYFNTIRSGMNRSDGVQWTHVTRLFEFIKGSYGGWVDSNGDWQTLCNTNTEFSSYSYKLTDNFTNTEISNLYGWMEFPYTTGYLFNQIVGQTCMPAQQFGYESTKDMPYTSNWNDVLLFFPQTEWIADYYRNNGSIIFQPGSVNLYDYWTNEFYENHLGGTKPVLIYSGKKDIQFSPADDSKTNYLAFTGDILWQQNCSYDHVNYHLWTMDESNHYYGGTLFPIKDAGAHDTHVAYARETGNSDFNKGWPMLKIKLSIGNRYWNGATWQFEECAAWIPYHKENVVSETETLIWSDYNKPVTNRDYTYKIGKDAYTIPITKGDGLNGKIKLQIYMPRIPWSDGLFYSTGSGTTSHPPQGNINVPTRMYINYQKTPPVIFMKNFSLELLSADNNREQWYRDFSDIDKKDDDIIYSNEINNQNVTEFDDLTLKINTYNSQEPISQSYIVEPSQYEYTSNDYYIASQHYVHGSQTTANAVYEDKQVIGYMYALMLDDFNGYAINQIQQWFNNKKSQGYFTDEKRGIPVRIKAETYETDGFLDQNFDNSVPVIYLRIGQLHTTTNEADTDTDGVQFYNDLWNAKEIKFLAPNDNYPPLDLYPVNLRRNESNIIITNMWGTKYHTDGFYRIHKNTNKREEMNVIERYVEHHSTPKKIYNCEVHGYYEPWKCISVNALNGLKMIVDEQEYDVKADTNELKLIEF